MPLIINELVTVMEQPAGEEQQAVRATGAAETERKNREWSELSFERQERLRCD